MKTEPTEVITRANLIGEFADLVQRGIDAWEKAGALLVTMIDEDANVRRKILEGCPHLSEAILSRFEAIGRRVLHPKTLLNNSPGMVRLRALPYDEQAKYLTEPVSVAFPLPSGKVEIQKIMISLLSKAQALQVISKTGVRSVAEQREILTRNGALKERGNLRDGNENEAHRLRKIYESLQTAPDKEEEPSALLTGAPARMDAALEKAHASLMEARTELSLIHHNHPMDGYVAGCLKGIGILRLAIKEERIK